MRVEKRIYKEEEHFFVGLRLARRHPAHTHEWTRFRQANRARNRSGLIAHERRPTRHRSERRLSFSNEVFQEF